MHWILSNLHRCLPRPGNVGSVPAVLRLFRVVRCNSNLPAVDHLSVVHKIRIWGDCAGHLRIRTHKAAMLPSVLSLQEPRHHPPRTGHGGVGHQNWHHCTCGDLHRSPSRRVLVLALEIEEATLNSTIIITFSLSVSRGRWLPFSFKNESNQSQTKFLLSSMIPNFQAVMIPGKWQSILKVLPKNH